MEQMNEQKAARPRGNPTWSRGTSANPKGRETKAQWTARRDALVSAWVGAAQLRAVDLALVQRAAELSR